MYLTKNNSEESGSEDANGSKGVRESGNGSSRDDSGSGDSSLAGIVGSVDSERAREEQVDGFFLRVGEGGLPFGDNVSFGGEYAITVGAAFSDQSENHDFIVVVSTVDNLGDVSGTVLGGSGRGSGAVRSSHGDRA